MPSHFSATEQSAHAGGHTHAARRAERFSLLRLSAAERLAGAAVIVALLWAAVYWALHGGGA